MRTKSFFFVIFTLLFVSCFWFKFSCQSQFKDKALAKAFLLASFFTDPLCNAHQLSGELLLVDTLDAQKSSFVRHCKKSLLFLDVAANSFFSVFTTLPGIELRFLARNLQNRPYLYFEGISSEKPLTQDELSLLSWNVCGVSGGYAITDGGVLPWRHRMERLIHAIREQDADVICLYEIFDIQTACRLFEGLQDIYKHFYLHIGANSIGLSSGLFVASKLKLIDPEFVAFPQKEFDGRAKHCRKGFFSFDIEKDCQRVVRIFATHLQHSEIPEYPSQGELQARKKEMELIVSYMQNARAQSCILTGDLNLDEKELKASDWNHFFDRGNILSTGFTWGGDQFCSILTGKAYSPPLNLDHTLKMKKGNISLTTRYIDSGFDGTCFHRQALSDHKGLLSTLTFGN